MSGSLHSSSSLSWSHNKDLDAVEMFCGVASIVRAFRSQGHKVHSGCIWLRVVRTQEYIC